MPTTNNIILSYVGPVSPSVISGLVEDIETKVKSLLINRPTEKKIINISIELLQNLFHYAHKEFDEELAKLSTFSLSIKERTVELYTGNFVSRENVDKLRKELQKINSFSKEELREFYKISMQASGSIETTNAGLGLIVIARQSENKLSFEFEKKARNMSYFHLTARVNY